MATTTNKEIFTSLYSSFGTLYNGAPMFDWGNYIKNYSNTQYYVWADLTPKIPVDRIPYWNYTASWIKGAKPDGYLPATTGAYYFKMRPINIYCPVGIETFLKNLTGGRYLSFGSMLSMLTANIISLYNEQVALKTTRLAAAVVIYTPQGYRSVNVDMSPTYFDYKLSVFNSSDIEKVKTQIDTYNAAFKDYLLSLEKLYNKCQVLLADPMVQKSPSSTKYVKAALAVASVDINGLQSDPDSLVKVCKECQKNARIGNPLVLPLIYVVGAIALAFIVKGIIGQYQERLKYVQTRKMEIDRVREDQNSKERIMKDPTLTEAQKQQLLQGLDTDIKDAQGNMDKQDTKGPGFFDRIENLALLVGGFMIMNNVTKSN